LLPTIARERLAKLRAQQESKSTERLSLLDYVPHISGDVDELERPIHLEPYVSLLERAINGNLRCVVAAPPQHGKSVVARHAFAWWAKYCPPKRHAYVTYSKEVAEYVSRKFTELAERAGLEPQGRLSDVQLKGGTEIRFTSIGGSLTSFAVDGVLLVDDPIKDRADAESPTIRRTAMDWLIDVGRSRRHQGTSIIVMATRWHAEDPSGCLIKRGYEYINLKAIAEPKSQDDVGSDGRIISDPLHRAPGEALWPSHKPAEFFNEERQDVYSWASLYQGEPRPRGGSVFAENPNLYRKLPDAAYRGAFGLDLAYSRKTHADWSILVELWREETADPQKPRFYVVDVQRKQVSAPEFALTLKAKRTGKPWQMRWYAAGTEKGSADFLKSAGLPIKDMHPKGDKFVRAQPVAAAWNSGRVLLPDPEVFEPKWLPAFLDVVQNFTGVNDDKDDDVDALAAAFDELVVPERQRATVIRRGPSL
jgi:predicted phage terminase large subunit-like protein